jgi:aspartate aminotransferase
VRLSPLAERLIRAERSPEIPWKILAENVPVWPDHPPVQVNVMRGEGDYAYAPSQGTDTLLLALSQRAVSQGFDIGTESILVTNGAFDATGLVARHLVASGVRRAVCAGPILLSIADLLRASGMEVVVREWPNLIDRQEWVSLGLGQSDLFYINTPHNPTGACLGQSATHAILEAKSRLGFAIVFDLVYDSFVYAQDVPATPLALVQDWAGVYGVNSFSKNYGMPGLRVGWVAGEPTAISELTARFEWEKISVNTEAQYRAAFLCQYGNASLIEVARSGRDILLAWAAANDVVADPWQGGIQMWADIDVGDAEEFANELMDKHQIVISTGANYYPQYPTRLRIPAGVPASLLKESLPLLVARH